MKALLEYGLLVLFVWVFVEQGGIPLPVAPLLLAVGALAAAQQMSLPLALVVTIVASLLADLLWYVIGRRRGGEALGVLCRVTLEPDYCVRRAQDLFLKHRLRSLLLGKFLPGINPLVAGLAGVAGIGVGRFVVYDVGSAALWAGTWTGLGYLLRDVLEEVTAWLSQLGEWAIALVAAVLAGYIGIKYAQRRRFLTAPHRAHRARGGPAPARRGRTDGRRRSANFPGRGRGAFHDSRRPPHVPRRAGEPPRGDLARRRDRPRLHLTERGHERPGGADAEAAGHHARPPPGRRIRGLARPRFPPPSPARGDPRPVAPPAAVVPGSLEPRRPPTDRSPHRCR